MASKAKRTIVVTGASRGLGLEWVRQLSASPDNFIVAVVRNLEKAKTVLELNKWNVITIQGDLSDLGSFPDIAAEIANATGSKLDVLINNAGMMKGADHNGSIGISKSIPSHWTDQFNVNVVGLVFFTIALLPLLEQGHEKKVINISSFFGDLDWSRAVPAFHNASYSVSKTAVTMATLKFHNEFKDKGFIFITLSPGWVETDMGGSLAPLKPEDSVRQCLSFVNRAQKEDSGRFFTLDGVPGAAADSGVGST